MTIYNEFVVRFANVNGSGSASANSMFAKALFRMGIPVTTRNIFPSNIQGLPTWFEVRVSEREYFGRRDKVDLVVAMNAETYAEDVDCLESDGYLLYDSTRGRPRELQRSDVNGIGVPITQLTVSAFSDPKQRQLFKNIVYLGALTTLLNIDFEVITNMVSLQYRGKDHLIQPNIKALEMGRKYATEYLDRPIDLQVRHSNLVDDRILVDGNEATALGAIYAGATVCAWYPITPSTSIAESFEKHASKLRVDTETKCKNYAVVQAEDELSALGMVIGASWNGVRAFTATSGPGISLMNEFLGLAYFAEIPAVIFDVQRAGPSTGMPTRTQQSDLLSVAFASHGDTRHPMVFPATPKECFDFAADAFDIAERTQTPVIMMSDLELGMNATITEPFSWDDERTYDRGKVLSAADLEELDLFGRYVDKDGDGIGYRTLPGAHPTIGSFFTRGTSRDEYAVYTEDPEIYIANMDRLERKWETIRDLVPKSIVSLNGGRSGIMFYGTTNTPMKESLELLEEQGIVLDTLCIRSYPFDSQVKEFFDNHDTVFLVEQNRDAQMKTLITLDLNVAPDAIKSILYYGGFSISADYIVAQVLEYYSYQKLPRLKQVS